MEFQSIDDDLIEEKIKYIRDNLKGLLSIDTNEEATYTGHYVKTKIIFTLLKPKKAE